MNELESLIFYIITFSISSIAIMHVGHLYNTYDKKNRRLKIIFYTLIGLTIPIFISSIRYKVGTDYNNYINIYYNNIKHYTMQEILVEYSEILFALVVKIACLFNDSQIMFMIMSLLTLVVAYKAILDNKENKSLGIMFFLYLFLYYTNSYNNVRQGLAIVIILCSYKYISSRNFIKFLVTVLIASLFHITAIFVLPFYLINIKSKKIRKWIRAIAVFLLVIIILNYNTFLNLLTSFEKLERYSMYTNLEDGSNREIIASTLILIVILSFRKPLIKYNSKNQLYIFFSIVNYILQFTGFISPFIKRIALYFGIVNIFLLSCLPNITKTKEQKILVYLALIMYGITMFTISAYILGQSNIIPYRTIFGNN